MVALYDETQNLPLPQMYGKNLVFKTGGVDGCDCAEILTLIEAGKIDTTPLIPNAISWRTSRRLTTSLKISWTGLSRWR